MSRSMSRLSSISRVFDPLGRAAARLQAALTDPARRERSVVVALAAYVVLWAIYGTVTKAPQGLHPDMTELVAWSRDLAPGYLKHPPLAAWLVAAWFAVLPVAEWSYYLLAMLMPGIALWFIWRLSADYLDADRRVVGLALLTLVPFFNFHALKFNVNTVMMPLWAATTFWFLRSYATRSRVYAALAGVGAAGCMLGKYWSVFLLAGLAVAALIDSRRGAYFRSAAPWITAAAGALALAPHLAWLWRHDFAPFAYATAVHGEKSMASVVLGALEYLGGAFGFVAIPLLIALYVIRPSAAQAADIFWPADRHRRLAASAFWAPLLLPPAVALAGGATINSLWAMPAWTLLPVMLLSAPAAAIPAADARRVVMAAIAVPFAMLLAAPAIAVIAQRNAPQAAAAQAPLLAAAVERAWQSITPQPLRFVGGNADLAYGVVTYSDHKPRALTGMEPPAAADLARHGRVIVCFADDAGCRDSAAAQAARVAGSRTVETTLARSFWTIAGRPRGYAIALLPPQPQ